ncbi:unnamed protein product [Peniophora sp. CBMAI 1063]|nr:unnamed protein product [Peniophora sp. CBMAI 1063]
MSSSLSGIATPARSRTPSRSGTPTPSRLTLTPTPVLRPTHSFSSMHVQFNSQTGQSSGSSETPDTNSGILVQEPEADVDTIERDVGSTIVQPIPLGDEESKKALRDQLRRTLNKKESIPDTTARRRRRNISEDVQELSRELVNSFPPRRYFVLTDAGKPVFVSNEEDRDGDNLASVIGLMQALISVFIDDGDKLRCINAGKTRITFLLRPPLYYACVSAWGEPESVTRTHLEYLHQQVLSVVTGTQLRRLFERRGNFDLGRLLTGAENLIHSLLNKIELDMAMNTSSLRCLKVDPSLRKKAANAIVPTTKMKDLLYIILVADGHVVTLARPRKHSIHPSDLHILLNTVHSPSILNSSASASWLPICLPKFNSTGFVNAFVSFLPENDVPPDHEGSTSSHTGTPDAGTPARAGSVTGSADGPSFETNSTKEGEGSLAEEVAPPPSAGLGLIAVSGGGDFEAIRAWGEGVVKRMVNEGSAVALIQAVRSGATQYSCADLGVPGLRHFVYKSRAHVQVTSPLYEDPYDDLHERRRLMTLYQILHDNIHAKSGQDLPLKLQYIRTEKEGVIGWITQPFELYMAVSPRLPKTAVIGAANAVARWIKKEEAHLFLRDAPVF